MHRIDYERFKSLIQEVLQQSRTGAVAFDLANPEYAPGISTAFTEWEVKLALPAEEANAVLEKVKARLQESPYFPSSNEIGGKVAGGTRRQAMAALLASLFFIIVYIWVRFQRLVYGLAAVVALVHDVIITLGVVALTYWLAPILGFLLIDEMKIGLDVLAAFLTLIGYSLNDTIVIFDRIREIKGKAPWITEEMINRSVIMGLLILYVIGGEGIHAFAFTMLFGVVTGTFSSVYIASPILLWLAGLSGEAKAEPNSSNRS
jgi:SecD/SecF fusion protein